jgi:ABC-type multidrug transport system fused ATPase/permease subunit
MNTKIIIPKGERHVALKLFLTIIFAIFAIELGIMLSLNRYFKVLPDFIIGVIDSALLTLILFPILYFLIFKPIIKQISRLNLAEENLKKAYDDLEDKVQERTSELKQSNKQLQGEINERKKTEEKLNKKIEELEKWQRLTVQREVKMIELKKEIKEVKEKHNKQ